MKGLQTCTSRIEESRNDNRIYLGIIWEELEVQVAISFYT